ncbi:sushi domain-containing protein 2-like isoform X2 [Babylonia areolata]|uniref:sushi domain-containing protein 2-like isoform X2 n=1 Tax=Babylonia areolata TaxID=304850 RepID=UPI003FD3DA44
MDEGKCAFVQLCVAAFCLLAVVTPAKAAGSQDVLYPYGPDAGDETLKEIGTHDISVPLPVPIKYYGQTVKTAYIVKDGMVSFEPGVRYLPLEWREGTPNHAIDRPFVAPFHHSGFTPLSHPKEYPGRIYYKLMSRARNDVSLSEDDRQLMLQVDDYLADATVVLKSGFTSNFVLKVTWENVSCSEDCTEDRVISTGCPSNTFQVLIAANTEHTFAIFNYYKMEIPFTVHQVAGLNGGHGRGWTDVIPCQGPCAKRSKGDQNRIASLVSRVGSDVDGRYILAVTDDIIVRGGCLADGLKFAELEVFPRQAGMFGGEMLSVSGTCSTPGTKIYCRFNRQAVSEGVMESVMRGRCPVPILTTRGEVEVEMSLDNVSWKARTHITIIHPARLPPPVDIRDLQEAWYRIQPDVLRLRWKSGLFSSNMAATLDLLLIGYREDEGSDSPVVMKQLEQLATHVVNRDEKYTVDPTQFSCSGSDCFDFEIALLQLRVADRFVDKSTKYQSITLGPVTLGWYVRRAMEARHGEEWPASRCHAWSDRDQRSGDWQRHLLPCPCTLEQALADWGRWQPDMGCNMFTGSVCTYHVGARHCVRSVHPSPDAAGNQCCYEEDGDLRYAADTYQGSTPDRAHDWGAAPFGSPGHVPSLSHWIQDVVTFYYCCLWVNYGDCSYYMDRRATRDCKDYVPPHAAAVYGDPHVTTFDGASYYFGGSGDFWLLQSDHLNIQGRFEERENEFLVISSQNQLAPTNLTSVVMWTPGSDVITIGLAPPGGPTNRKLDIRVGNQRRFFEESSQMFQDFKEVSIVNNAGSATTAADRQHSNFTVLFVGGAGVQVAERRGLFHVMVVLPPNSGKTAGLLGTLDGDRSNDFRNPQGQIVPPYAQEDTLYLDFSLHWGVAQNESKFHWPNAASSSSPLFGNAKDFAYKPDAANMRPPDGDVQRLCGLSQSCRRDYYVSSDANVARDTRRTEERFTALRESQTIVRTCGLLDIPMAEKTPRVYREGTVVTVTGCRPGSTVVRGSGPRVYTCNTTALSPSLPVWSPEPARDLCPSEGEEEAVEKSSDVGMIVGIAVGVVVVMVIVIVVIVILARRKRESASAGEERDDRPVPARRANVPADVTAEPGTEEALLKNKKKDRDTVKMSEVITEMKGRRGSTEEV